MLFLLMKVLRRRGSEVLFNAEAVRGTNSIFSEVVRSFLIGELVSSGAKGKSEYEGGEGRGGVGLGFGFV